LDEVLVRHVVGDVKLSPMSFIVLYYGLFSDSFDACHRDYPPLVVVCLHLVCLSTLWLSSYSHPSSYSDPIHFSFCSIFLSIASTIYLTAPKQFLASARTGGHPIQ